MISASPSIRFARPLILVISLLCWLIALPCASQVVINEIMYAPLAPEPEWIELYNAGAGPVNLSGWTLRDESDAIATIPARSIAGGAYLVLTRDTTKLRSIRAIGGEMARMTLPSLNNAGDIVVLRDANGKRIDSLRFNSDWGGEDGSSLERHLFSDRSTRSSTWESSTSPTRATAGTRNSISPVHLNLAIDSVEFDPEGSIVSALVLNDGIRSTPAAVIALAHDADGDGTASGSERVIDTIVAPLAPGSSATLRLRWPRPLVDEGEPMLVEIMMEGDEIERDNVVPLTLRRPAADTGLVITEIMFEPLAVDEESGAEYVELFNRGDRMVPIVGWKLYDATGKIQATMPKGSPAIPPAGYLVIASDAIVYDRYPWLRDSGNVVIIGRTSFGLNADEDRVILRNTAGRTVDSVRYLDDWHWSELSDTRGIALERISTSAPSNDARSWSSSVAPLGGTPGAVNSHSLPVSTSRAELDITPSTISPDGDGFEDFTRISWRLSSPTARIVITVHDRNGVPVARVANNEPSGPAGELVWNGHDDASRPLQPGIYLIRLEGYDEGGQGATAAQRTVIIARALR